MSSEKDIKTYSVSELRQFQSLSVHHILESPIWSSSRFRETSSDFNSTEKSVLFWKVFTKIITCDDPLLQLQVNKVLSEISTDKYFTQTLGLLSRIEVTSPEINEEWLEILDNLVKFLQQLCSKIPTTALASLGLCNYLNSTITRFISQNSDERLNSSLLAIKNDIEDIQKSISENLIKPQLEKRREKQDKRKPPNDFRKIPILPTRDDIFHEPFLRKNLIEGFYDNLDHYLDIQFRLLREDCIAQLRGGIFEYIEAKTIDANREIRRLQDVKLYKNVTIVSKEESTNGLLHEIKLDQYQVSRVRWERSKRLLYGSLLCLSPDNFDTLYFAVIENADYDKIKTDCTIKVSMRKGKGQLEVPLGLSMTMVESSAYFESYKHVLSSLQNIKEEDLPFRRYIVEGCKDIKPPSYVEEDEEIEYDLEPIINQNFIFRVFNHRVDKKQYRLLSDEWPSAEELHLDESQFQALKCALTREFVIIQGPPGTGKTHLGLVIAKVLLHNKTYWMNEQKVYERLPVRGAFRRYPPPRLTEEASSAMLIVCYTNHALDQFMEGIVNFLDPDSKQRWGSKLVRVGSRCSNPKIEEYSLKYKRREFHYLEVNDKQYLDELQKTYRKISKIKWIMKKSIQNIFGEDILSPWIEEVDTLLKNSKDFGMLEWLKIDENSLLQAAYKDYEKYALAKAMGETIDVTNTASEETMEKIIIDTEAELINAERHVEDDEFEVDLEFEEIGVSVDLIIESILKNGVFDDLFKKLLDDHGRKVKLKILSNDVMAPSEIEKAIKRPWRISDNQRWRMYRYFILKLRERVKDLLRQEEKKYAELHEKYLREKQKIDREILLHSAIIAMTTSGAARYQDVLREVGPRVIIVEEAAEVLEAHIIATLNSNCEHLILIGDHKQLEPKPAVYKLAEEYNLALSMFERMINLGLPYVCLERQHRMRPLISQLVRPVYAKLVDNENVFQYEHVMGIEKDVYFVSHTKEESTKEETRSYWNDHEALYIQRLTRYLLKQGYTTNQITILTPYSGQMFLIRDHMPRREFEGIHISILDNYQGEENDIVLLSLVRSNNEGKIGFLNKENRVCVALSRAKIGLYVIGNFDIIRKFSYRCKLWGKAIKMMEQNGALGKGLPLFCRIHKSSRIYAVLPSDFDKAPEGGCSLQCDIRRNCGHACDLYCHPRDPEHKEIECRKMCSKVCVRDHKCKKRCHFPKDCMCDVKMIKSLPCKHELALPCHVDPETIKCQVQVDKELLCGHSARIPCYEDPASFVCKVLVERKLNCGHLKKLPCHTDHELYKCKEIVRKNLPCEHEAEMYCWENPVRFKCKQIVHRTLSCNHEIDLECYIDVEFYKCLEKVIKQLPCGHECELQCFESKYMYRIQCKKDVTEKRTISLTSKTPRLYRYLYLSRLTENSCDHTYTRKCYESAKDYQINNPCKEIVKKTLKCGHDIEIACHLREDDIKCKARVMTDFECHHENVEVSCHLKPEAECQAKCGKVCESDHVCQKKCHFPNPCTCKIKMKKQKECGHMLVVECREDVSTIACDKPVEKRLPCGHIKTLPCKINVNNADVQCKEKVVKLLKCKHSLLLPCHVDPDDPTIKCLTKTERDIPFCGHKIFIECYKNPDTENCEKKVHIVRPECGHETEILCYLKKQLFSGLKHFSDLPSCKTLVAKELPCGHILNVPCSEKKTSHALCKEPCKSVLLCGHICKGSCSECKLNFQHRECQKICNKMLICGHQCKSSTCGSCGPCSNTCGFGCSHLSCTHPCNKACEICTKPCDWACPHYKCSKLCSDVCDRPKCNERCTKKLTCGHQCIGFCGDPCPKLCKKCNHKEIQRLSKDGSNLFVELQDCGHTFNSKTIDAYMEHAADVFYIKRCPKCSKVITWHPRYQTELKKQSLTLNEIRNTIDSVSKKLNVFTYPILAGFSESCLEYITKFGTFVAANEQSLQQINNILLTSAKHYLQSMKQLLQKKKSGNQRYHSIYTKLRVIRAWWKVFIVIQYNTLSPQMTSEQGAGVSEKEDLDSDDSDDDETGRDYFSRQDSADKNQEGLSKKQFKYEKIQEFKRNLELLQNSFIKSENDLDYWSRDVEERMDYFAPFLSKIGKAWIQTAAKSPELIAVIEIHAETWKMCANGHPFSFLNEISNCVICLGLDRLSLQPFQIPQETDKPGQNKNYNEQGARPKTRGKQVEDDGTAFQKNNSKGRNKQVWKDNPSGNDREFQQDYPTLVNNDNFKKNQRRDKRKENRNSTWNQTNECPIPIVFGNQGRGRNATRHLDEFRFDQGRGNSQENYNWNNEFPSLEKRETFEYNQPAMDNTSWDRGNEPGQYEPRGRGRRGGVGEYGQQYYRGRGRGGWGRGREHDQQDFRGGWRRGWGRGSDNGQQETRRSDYGQQETRGRGRGRQGPRRGGRRGRR
ncbi:NFX1-type zinc finger-containing protein 1-like [Saccostrea echinata]|uniref:NFX1-type zinc finger-containing protein 1-like n=1 Tax=Saccostrea echinata TaxID=191078 RepID=UPI002A836A30|nr:NFX1-type zinc finger-containing protein 1-like [Saccostrea echinata]